jgi:MFS family permease
MLVAIAVLAQAGISFVELGIPVLAPFIQEGLGLSAAGVGIVVSSINLGRVLGSIPSGRLVDALGERAVMTAGGFGVAAFTLLAAPSPHLVLLLAFACAGLFAGSASPAGSKLILAAFPRERRGLPMGIRQAAVPLGALLATAAIPLLAGAVGWRWALALAALVPLGATLVSLVGIRRLPRLPREAAPVPLRTVMGDRDILLASVWAMLFVGGQYAVLVYLIIDLTTEIGLRLATAVVLLAVATLAGVVGRMAWGWLSDRVFGGRRLPGLVAVTVTGAASAACLAALPVGSPVLLAGAAAALAGFSLIGWQGLWVTMVSELAPPGASGTALGYGLTFTNVGIVVWPPLLGLAADLTGTFRTSWIVLAVVLLASLLPLLTLRRRRARATISVAPATV